jgi:hypothetical protein
MQRLTPTLIGETRRDCWHFRKLYAPLSAKSSEFAEFSRTESDAEAVKELPGTVPILRSLRSKLGLSPSPGQFFHNLSACGRLPIRWRHCAAYLFYANKLFGHFRHNLPKISGIRRITENDAVLTRLESLAA